MLRKEEFHVLNSLYNQSVGRSPVFSDVYLNAALERSEVLERLVSAGYVDGQFRMITPAGVAALEPYRVEHAVIMAAGPSTRCIPLSLELPKGLFNVKGQHLIDREIEQLQEAGVTDITVVLGYKKEMLRYLGEKYGVRLIENPDFLTKNNIHSLLLAREWLRNSYVCACDDYFAENPFNRYEYQSFYAGIHADAPTNEMYVFPDEDGRIVKMQKNLSKGFVALGHAYWQTDFAEAFLRCVDRTPDAVNNPDYYWEWVVKDHIDDLPPFFFKRYAANAIVEFDYFDDLRRFDSGYVKHTHSAIVGNIISVFHCTESEIHSFRKISEGLTNTSFIFRYRDQDYIYRHPGEGTSLLVNRAHEKQSLELAKAWGIDPTYIYMDVEQGWKISRFVSEFREPDYGSMEDSEKIAAMLRRLHSLPITVDYGLRPWEDAAEIEAALERKEPGCFAPFLPLKAQIAQLLARTKGDGVQPCFCHGDTYKPNWMLKPDGSVILIDWEYAGFSDPGIDVGYYIVDASYDFPEAERFLTCYLGADADASLRFHYMAYVAITAYYWFVWAMYREQCGASMPEARENWKQMAVRYAARLLSDRS